MFPASLRRPKEAYDSGNYEHGESDCAQLGITFTSILFPRVKEHKGDCETTDDVEARDGWMTKRFHGGYGQQQLEQAG